MQPSFAAIYAALKECLPLEKARPYATPFEWPDPRELADMLRTLATYCSSTALALSMHTHQVAIPTWRWRHQQAPVDGFLRRVASDQLILVKNWFEELKTRVKR